jgi:hypothetical protein
MFVYMYFKSKISFIICLKFELPKSDEYAKLMSNLEFKHNDNLDLLITSLFP